ncbi:MAG: OTU protein [Ramalina farinacea]|uniref:OTU protein n=1 Tax=Ramalina farinacea TaxID=258253 RepID=A0AA43QGD8_9LECA|nr:OTU protein [Ramalina farinacea]
MDELQKKHRKEQKDLQSQITQKKKSATKKTRKSINDECETLVRSMKERHAVELAEFNGDTRDRIEAAETAVPEASDYHDSSFVEGPPGKPSAELSETPPSGSNDQGKKPNRQKTRLARRAAEQEAAIHQAEIESANLPNRRDREIESMRNAYQARGLKEHAIRSDGHCLYAAITDQLTDSGLGMKPTAQLPIKDPDGENYVMARAVAASYIASHAPDFEPYLDQPLDKYVDSIQNTGEWGGHVEILALAKAYSVTINVLHGDGHIDEVASNADTDRGSLWLAYYRHTFGLGEHYNSLRAGSEHK